MIWIIIGIAVYLLSVFGMWRYCHLAYSKEGIWSILDPDFGDIFWMLIPILNTIAVIAHWVEHPLKSHKHFNYNKFFNIKE